jgi:hypothetical protein
MGVPANYDTYPYPPAYLRLPEGVAQTNYRNELEWGFGWADYSNKPVNAHWRHSAVGLDVWDIDQDGFWYDSRASCVTCHNPHGARNASGEPTIAMTPGDLDIRYGVYDDGVTEWEYGYIGNEGFHMPGGDLHCRTCHPQSGAGEDTPPHGPFSTRYYRLWLDLISE